MVCPVAYTFHENKHSLNLEETERKNIPLLVGKFFLLDFLSIASQTLFLTMLDGVETAADYYSPSQTNDLGDNVRLLLVLPIRHS